LMGRFETYLLKEAAGNSSDFTIKKELTQLFGDKVKTNNKTRWHLRMNVTYLVNTIRVNSSINTKELTPEKFNIVGMDLTLSDLYNKTYNMINNLNYDDNIKNFLKEMLDTAKKKGNDYKINSYNVKSAEMRTIANDFGEILCAIWSMKNIGFRKIHFPIMINQPLLDFYGISGNVKYPISVKSGSGSATSLKNIKDLILASSYDSFSDNEIKIIEIIKDITKLNVMDGIIETNKTLNTNGINVLSKITKIPVSNISVKELNVWLNGKKSGELKKKLSVFYKKINNFIDDKTWNRYDSDSLSKPIGIIIGPLGHSTIKELNSKENMKLLSSIASKVVLLQLNINITQKKMSFKYKRFRDFSFKFSWQGGAPNPNRNKLGFKAVMVK